MTDEAEYVSGDITPVRPRFCGRCGAIWPADSEPCACTTAPVRVAPPVHVGPTFRSAIALYFAMLGLSIVLIIFMLVSGGDSGAAMDIGISFAFAAVVLPWIIRYAPVVFPLLWPRGNVTWYAFALVIPAFTFLFASVVVGLLQHTLSVPDLQYSTHYRTEGYNFGWLVLSTCVIPGVFEEIAFRGIIFDGMRQHLTVNETIIVTSAIFAILHLSILSIPHLFLLGMIFGFLRSKTQSLLPGMIAHFLHNYLVCYTEWWKVSLW